MDDIDILIGWKVPFINKNGFVLIHRNDASICVEKVFDCAFQLLGIDAFILSDDEKIQSYLEFSLDNSLASLSSQEVNKYISNIPHKITHFQFIFK